MTKAAISFRLLILSVLTGVSGAALVFSGNTQAAVTQGYQVSPPVTTLALDRGTSTRQTVKVTNLTSEQLTLQVGKRNFVAKGEEGEVELIDDANPRYSLAPYFTLSQPTVTIPPKGTREVSYMLSVPLDAEPGGRYGSVTFNTIPTKLPSGQSGAAVRQELAALIFLRINGPAHEQLEIASFKPDKDFYEYGPVGLITRVRNLGNVHEKPTGEIVVTNMLGLKTASIKLEEKNVIPGAVRRLGSTLSNKYLFGYYTATLTLRNGTVQTLTAKTSFWAIPYRLLAVVLVVLGLLFLIVWKGRRRLGKAIRILAGRE